MKIFNSSDVRQRRGGDHGDLQIAFTMLFLKWKNPSCFTCPDKQQLLRDTAGMLQSYQRNSALVIESFLALAYTANLLKFSGLCHPLQLHLVR